MGEEERNFCVLAVIVLSESESEISRSIMKFDERVSRWCVCICMYVCMYVMLWVFIC